jgi:hypothetical protein
MEGAMPEVTEIADALHAVADALNTFAGVAAWGAAAEHSDTHGRQSEIAAVILRFAKEGYLHTRINGENVSQADADMARAMFDRVFGPPKKQGR